jgi:hypothetical protein
MWKFIAFVRNNEVHLKYFEKVTRNCCDTADICSNPVKGTSKITLEKGENTQSFSLYQVLHFAPGAY